VDTVSLYVCRCSLLLKSKTEWAWRSLSVGSSIVSPAKIAAPIEMPFELRTRVGPGNHVLDGGPDLLSKLRGNFEGRSAVSCAKTAEPIKVPFQMWAPVGPRKHVLDGGADWRN